MEAMVRMYNIICIDKITKEWKIIHTVSSKREAIEWIRVHESEYPDRILNFVREGFEPIIE